MCTKRSLILAMTLRRKECYYPIFRLRKLRLREVEPHTSKWSQDSNIPLTFELMFLITVYIAMHSYFVTFIVSVSDNDIMKAQRMLFSQRWGSLWLTW